MLPRESDQGYQTRAVRPEEHGEGRRAVARCFFLDPFLEGVSCFFLGGLRRKSWNNYFQSAGFSPTSK